MEDNVVVEEMNATTEEVNELNVPETTDGEPIPADLAQGVMEVVKLGGIAGLSYKLGHDNGFKEAIKVMENVFEARGVTGDTKTLILAEIQNYGKASKKEKKEKKAKEKKPLRVFGYEFDIHKSEKKVETKEEEDKSKES